MDYDDIVYFTLDLSDYLVEKYGISREYYDDLEQFVASKLDKFETKERNFN